LAPGKWQAGQRHGSVFAAAATAPRTKGLFGGGVAGGCGNTTGDAHKFQHCQVSMHPFYGLSVGAEGYGQSVIWKVCQQTSGIPNAADEGTANGKGNATGEGNAMDEDASFPQPAPRRAPRAASAGVINAVAAARDGRAGVCPWLRSEEGYTRGERYCRAQERVPSERRRE